MESEQYDFGILCDKPISEIDLVKKQVEKN